MRLNACSSSAVRARLAESSDDDGDGGGGGGGGGARRSRYTRDFDELRRLGKGGQGTVFVARHKIDHAEYAVQN